MITQELVRKSFDYKDGSLVWKISRRGVVIGARAGTAQRSCRSSPVRTQIKLGGNRYYAHRLIFLFHHGWMPKEIDHVNGDSTDDRIENLRAVTHSQNMANARGHAKSKSGIKGVFWLACRRKWRAKLAGKVLGNFDSREEASQAYRDAAIEKYGECARIARVGNSDLNV